MTFSKASRTSVLAALLCLLLMGFAGASYGAIKFDVFPSPTEVINTGMSEVVGSIKFVVYGTGNASGSATLGDAQLAITYNGAGTYMEIDNTPSSGIVLNWSSNFNAANPEILEVVNNTIGGNTYGSISINLTAGANTLIGGEDYVILDGVRGRIATSTAVTQGNDLFAKIQSANDPSAYSFTDSTATYRVATSYPGMAVKINDNTNLLLCFPTTGAPDGQPAYASSIVITEGFARAFVDADANGAGPDGGDRVDDTGAILGAPTNSTEFGVALSGLPASVSSIYWPTPISSQNGSTSWLELIDVITIGPGEEVGVYSYQSDNQSGWSDRYTETFIIQPRIFLGSNQTDVGTIKADANLSPPEFALTTGQPDPDNARPRFAYVPQTDSNQINTMPGGVDPPLDYAHIIRCNCYMLFTYVAARNGFDTGFAVSNTSQDQQVFGSLGAPDQEGPITFYFYDSEDGYVGSLTTALVEAGQTYTGLLSEMVQDAGITGEFSGYIIAKAEFQYCHAVSYIADSAFAATAQGYLALIIPDPAVKGPFRMPAAAADPSMMFAGESLNN